MAIPVGTAAPDFTLKDQNQKEVKLSDFKGKKNVVVVFYPAGLESGVHQRARVLCERYEEIRAARRAGAGRERG